MLTEDTKCEYATSALVEIACPQQFDTLSTFSPSAHAAWAVMNNQKKQPDLGNNLGAQCVQALLAQNGIEHKQRSWAVAEALGLSYSQAHRKVSATASWSLEEIARVAAHFKTTLAHALEPVLDPGHERAVLVLGGLRLPCQVLLGELVSPPFADDVVAISVPGTWLIVPSAEIKLPARAVQRLTLTSAKSSPE